MEREEWLLSLDKGSEVCVSSSFRSPRIDIIERVTPTLLVTKTARFNRKTGREVGAVSSWNVTRIEPVSDTFRNATVRAELKQKIIGRLDDATTEELTSINAILIRGRS